MPYEFLIIPHWRVEGGAGCYIRDLIVSLRQVGNVQVAGQYASDYDNAPIRSACLDRLTCQSLPTYKSIHLAATLYHAFFSALRAIAVLATPQQKRFKGNPATLILTSSIQAMAVPIARQIFPGSQIAIVVQENVYLSRGLGRLTRFLLKRADIVVSITETWARHARENDLDPIVLPNSYDPDYASTAQNVTAAIESDLLYVGGDAKIKGFDNLIAALPALLNAPGRRIVCLGHYSKTARKTLARIGDAAHRDAQLDIVGLVPDIRAYLRGTKLLILPIGSPHFCRPAIEAGMFGKTFVIPDFPELADFALDGKNCATYQSLDIANFIFKISQLLYDSSLMKRLGDGNAALARNFSNVSKYAQAFVQRLCDTKFKASELSGRGGRL